MGGVRGEGIRKGLRWIRKDKKGVWEGLEEGLGRG